jgi:hypothetical protein
MILKNDANSGGTFGGATPSWPSSVAATAKSEPGRPPQRGNAGGRITPHSPSQPYCT